MGLQIYSEIQKKCDIFEKKLTYFSWFTKNYAELDLLKTNDARKNK